MCAYVCQICPEVDPSDSDDLAGVEDVFDSSLTPAALKKLSRSVMDISALSEMKDISQSTSELMTKGGVLGKLARKAGKAAVGIKSESKTSLLSSVPGSLENLAIDAEVLVSLSGPWWRQYTL